MHPGFKKSHLNTALPQPQRISAFSLITFTNTTDRTAVNKLCKRYATYRIAANFKQYSYYGLFWLYGSLQIHLDFYHAVLHMTLHFYRKRINVIMI